MRTAPPPLFVLDHAFARELPELTAPWTPAPWPAPRLLAGNDALAAELGLDVTRLFADEGVGVLAGAAVPPGAVPVAQGYAGHQFGGYSPRLGDGRAVLLGELHDPQGRTLDLHLKGAGRTPYSRGGDGKAAVGPMLRELVVGEAMHALGIPTTRALAVVATGETIRRDTPQPGAVLARLASSHLRVGSFQYASALEDPTVLPRLADHAVRRHHPHAADAEHPYLALYEAVLDAQARLVAQWLHVGFVHGVMNTDNMTISGETIDYGPCAFLDAFDPTTVFSSIDHQGRYAFGNQPGIAQWNLARFAEAILPLLADDADEAVARATDVLRTFPERHDHAWHAGMCAKLGLAGARDDDAGLVDDLLRLLHEQRVDHTGWYRALADVLRGDRAPAHRLVTDPAPIDAWLDRWTARVGVLAGTPEAAAVAAGMDRVNPCYVPRNHLVEAALAAATADDLGPLEELRGVLARPFERRPGLERYEAPAPAGSGAYRTFCGT